MRSECIRSGRPRCFLGRYVAGLKVDGLLPTRHARAAATFVPASEAENGFKYSEDSRKCDE